MSRPNVEFKTGDIFLTDNFRTASKIVKFLMTAPTCWHHLWWFLFNKKKLEEERPRFYHAGMIYNSEKIIEQQGKVEFNDLNKIFKKNYVIWRYKKLTAKQAATLKMVSTGDLGEGYGILECIGKTIAWVTGIKWFAKWFDMKNNAICLVRVCEWYKIAVGYTFGVSDPDYLTTKMVDEYCQEHPEDWECIAIKFENEN